MNTWLERTVSAEKALDALSPHAALAQAWLDDIRHELRVRRVAGQGPGEVVFLLGQGGDPYWDQIALRGGQPGDGCACYDKRGAIRVLRPAFPAVARKLAPFSAHTHLVVFAAGSVQVFEWSPDGPPSGEEASAA